MTTPLILHMVHNHVLSNIHDESKHPYEHAFWRLSRLVPSDKTKQALQEYCQHYHLSPPTWFNDLKGKTPKSAVGARMRAKFLDDEGTEYWEDGTVVAVVPFEGIWTTFGDGPLMITEEDPWHWHPKKSRSRSRSPVR